MTVRERLRPWAPVGAWAGLILVITTVPLPDSTLDVGGFPLDKAVHLVLYLGLGWTSGRALVRTGRFRPGPILGLWIGGLAFAALDEWHQTWVATRVPSILDWSADAVGLTLGLSAVAVWRRLSSGTGRSGGRTPSRRESTGGPGSAGVGRRTSEGDHEREERWTDE